MIAVGMWIHIYLTIAVVYRHSQVRNPIWAELRAMVAAIPVAAAWILLSRVAA